MDRCMEFDHCINIINDIYINIQQNKKENWFHKLNELFSILEKIAEKNKNNKEYIDKLNKSLTLIEDGMNRKDYFLMSDYLFYEIKPIIENWKKEIPKIVVI